MHCQKGHLSRHADEQCRRINDNKHDTKPQRNILEIPASSPEVYAFGQSLKKSPTRIRSDGQMNLCEGDPNLTCKYFFFCLIFLNRYLSRLKSFKNPPQFFLLVSYSARTAQRPGYCQKQADL